MKITPIWIVLRNESGKWGGFSFADINPWRALPDEVRAPVSAVTEPIGDAAIKGAEALYDYSVGPKNPVSSGLDALGFHKAAGLTSMPSWDELARPGEAFANNFDKQAGVLPPSWRQYAEPAVATMLNFVPGVGPLLSAGFSTAYNAGNMQRNQKGMDWGKVGVDAAKNFGTAAIQMGAAKLASNANAAQGANTAAKATQGAANSSSLAQNMAGQMGQAAGAGTGTALGSSIPQGYNLASTGSTLPAASALQQFRAQNVGSADTSQSSIPQVRASGTTPTNTAPSVMDKAYNGSIQPVSNLASNALASTLAPTQSTPLSGFDTAMPTGSEVADGYQFGDQLKAFRDPNATGGITPEELNNMTMKIGYNNYQQQQGARDTYLPAGQVEPQPNTPYSKTLTNINQGTEKSYEDLLKEVDNYNAINRIMEANPTFSMDEINSYIQDPTQTPESFRPWLQGLQPMTGFNTGLMR